MQYDCLLIDDDVVLAETTSEYLNLMEIKTAYVTDSGAGERFLQEHKVDLILLDVNLAEDSGFVFCKKLRKNYDMPILFISARNSQDDILMGLGVGGDDYIEKPYSLSILAAKIKAVLKRAKKAGGNKKTNCPIRIDKYSGKVFVKDREVVLRDKEYALLAYLMEEKGRIVSKEELFSKVWKDMFTGDNTLNVHIRHLREKLEMDPNQPEWIQTVWGRGYCFRKEEEET